MSVFHGRPDLLARFRAGDREALEVVYRAYVGKVSEIVSHGFRTAATGAPVPGLGRRPADLEDTVQEIFLRAFSGTARRSFDGSRDFGPYMGSIARNVMIDRARRSGRELLMPEVDLEVAARSAATASDPYAEIMALWEDPQAIGLARRFIEGLPAELARVHRVLYIEDLSQREAAEDLGISRQTLRTLGGKLREGLRQVLSRNQSQEQTKAVNHQRSGSGSPALQ